MHTEHENNKNIRIRNKHSMIKIIINLKNIYHDRRTNQEIRELKRGWGVAELGGPDAGEGGASPGGRRGDLV